MDPSTLPVWAQGAATIAIAIVAAVVGVFKYLKTQTTGRPGSEEGSAAVVSASFIDSKVLKELIESIREHQEESSRDAKKALRASQDLKDAVQENTEAIIVQTDATTNLLRFVNRGVPRPARFSDVEKP